MLPSRLAFWIAAVSMVAGMLSAAVLPQHAPAPPVARGAALRVIRAR